MSHGETQRLSAWSPGDDLLIDLCTRRREVCVLMDADKRIRMLLDNLYQMSQ